MRRIAVLLFVLALCGLVSAVNAAGKTTVDPNTVKAKPTAETQAVDERLAQKVTYEGGYKRLHTAIDDISALTGVQLYSGSSSKDWQVRDIPVTICVKDMPLGKLLNSIAKATHLTISSEMVDGARVYRIRRDLKSQKEFDEYFERKRDVSSKLSDWSWDTLIRAKDIPESTINEVAKTPQKKLDCKSAQVLGKLLAELGPTAKKKVLSGDVITLTPRTAESSTRDILREYYTLCWQGQMNWREPKTGKTEAGSPDNEDIEKCVISIRPDPEDGDIAIDLIPLKVNDVVTCCGISLSTYIYAIRDIKGFDPKDALHSSSDAKPSVEENNDLKILKKDVDWNLPILQGKVLLEKPRTEDGPVTADALTALAKASGLNVICEDFQSHKTAWSYNVSGVFGTSMTVADVLRRVLEMQWSPDEKEKTLVGVAMGWRDRHRNLVSESTITNFRKKLDGNGAELEDYLMLLQLSNRQIADWFGIAANMPELSQGYVKETDKILWLLYDYINLEDKTLAKSESGFPLAKCDPKWLEDALKKRAWVMENTMKYTYLQSPDGLEKQEIDTIPTDAAATLVMRLKSEKPGFIPRVEIKGDSRDVHFDSPPADCTRLWYYLEVSGEKDGEKFQVRIDGPHLAFPLYSPKREKQLAEIAAAKNTKN